MYSGVLNGTLINFTSAQAYSHEEEEKNNTEQQQKKTSEHKQMDTETGFRALNSCTLPHFICCVSFLFQFFIPRFSFQFFFPSRIHI